MKLVLKERNTTPTCMTPGELGSFPISIEANYRMLSCGYKLYLDMNAGSEKVSALMLRLSLYGNTQFKLPWLKYVHSLINKLGLSFIWLNIPNVNYSIDQLKRLVNSFYPRYG